MIVHAVSDGYLVESVKRDERPFGQICDALGLSQVDLDTIIVTFLRKGLTRESRHEKIDHSQRELAEFADALASQASLWPESF